MAQTQSSHLLVQNFLRLQPPQTSFLSCLGPHFFSSTVTTTAALSKRLPQRLKLQWHNIFAVPRSRPVSSRPFTSSSLSFRNSNCSSSDALANSYEEVDVDDDDESETEDCDEIELERKDVDTSETSREVTGMSLGSNGLKVPSLTVKEKKELASHAHSLGKKLKSQSVGKSGVTANLATSFIETLEANELLKIKIHRTCPGELDEVLKQLEQATGSVVVGKIGRTVIIYKPSISKMKAEEKKRHASKVYVRKQPILKSASWNREKTPPFSQHGGRRGSTRLSTVT